MIYSYGVTRIGTYHIEHDIVCQDAHYIKKLSDSCVIAAVADGLGSELYSDIASKEVSHTSVEYCASKFDPKLDDDEVLDLIEQSFRVSQNKIEEIARSQNHESKQYDTTLDLVIYTKGKLFYGHAGDSGIVALLSDGTYKQLTIQSRDEFGYVFPLCFEDRWVFGVSEKEVASVFLATDGILETLFPAALRSQPVKLYVALAQYFMDRDRLGFEELGEETVTENMSEYISSIPGEQVNDDKTVVVLSDSEVKMTRQPDEYYAVPDFQKLEQEREEAYRRAAYPHLYKNEEAAGSEKQEAEAKGQVGKQQPNSALDEDDSPKGTESPEKRSPKMTFGNKLFQKRDNKEAP